MNTKADELLGYCGLYCGNCSYYVNSVKGTGTLMDDGTTVFCEGCNSSHTTPWCADCEVKVSNRKKGTRYCLQCSDFPCRIINEFMENPLYPYHKDVPADMKLLNEIGLDAWAIEMEKNYICKTCGDHFTYFDLHCPRCTK